MSETGQTLYPTQTQPVEPPDVTSHRNSDAEGYAALLGDVRGALAEAMIEAGISRAELARRLGVRPSVVTRVMNPAADILLSTLFDIAFALGRKWHFHLDT